MRPSFNLKFKKLGGFNRCKLKMRYIWRRAVIVFLKKFSSKSSRSKPKAIPVIPVILLENIEKSVSAAAKASIVISLANQLREIGLVPHVWEKCSNYKQTRLIAENANPSEISNEAFIISRSISTWASNDFEEAISAAAHFGANIFIVNSCQEKSNYESLFRISLLDVSKKSEEDVLSGPAFNKLCTSDAIILIDSFESKELQLPQIQRSIYKTNWEINFENIDKKEKILGLGAVEDFGAFYKMLLNSGKNIVGFVPLINVKKMNIRHLSSIQQISKHQQSLIVTSDKDYIFLPKKFKKQIVCCKTEIKVPKQLILDIESLYKGKFFKEGLENKTIVA